MPHNEYDADYLLTTQRAHLSLVDDVLAGAIAIVNQYAARCDLLPTVTYTSNTLTKRMNSHVVTQHSLRVFTLTRKLLCRRTRFRRTTVWP